jgi:hypothetical protein
MGLLLHAWLGGVCVPGTCLVQLQSWYLVTRVQGIESSANTSRLQQRRTAVLLPACVIALVSGGCGSRGVVAFNGVAVYTCCFGVVVWCLAVTGVLY